MRAIRDHFRAPAGDPRRAAAAASATRPPTSSSSAWPRPGASTASTRSSTPRSRYREATARAGDDPLAVQQLHPRRDRGDRRRADRRARRRILAGLGLPRQRRRRRPSTTSVHLVYKVETHNSPSALDPYGGAITGIVGVNRDPFGTGLGSDLLANVWGYCFASPFHDGELPPGLLHPRRIRDGVHQGVIDGGNQSGIPYGRGWELFDERYLGKPLVFCGTVGALPVTGRRHARRGEGAPGPAT